MYSVEHLSTSVCVEHVHRKFPNKFYSAIFKAAGQAAILFKKDSIKVHFSAFKEVFRDVFL